jgi:pyridoxine 5-phosphate synthase
MTKLSVNLNKFALLRNARGTDYPNLLNMAKRTIAAGVHGLTVHPRPDQRHAKYSDVYDLSKLLSGYPGLEFNIEGNPIEKFLSIVKEVKPDQCTLVPDAANQITSDHGWNLKKDGKRLIPILKDLQAEGIRVSLFMDTETDQIDIAKEIGADRVELHTEPYARAFGTSSEKEVYDRFHKAAIHAQSIGLGVNAGHDLNLQNLGLFLTIPAILEVSIGHAIAVESFDYSYEGTLQRYMEIISKTLDK